MTSEQTAVAGSSGERRIVVGLDGSDCAKRALDYAADEAAQSGAILQIVSIYNIPTEGSWIRTGLFHEDAITVVTDAIGQVKCIEPDLVTKGEATLGVPGPVLAEVAEGASGLVVGTRGHGEVAGVILGSVSEYVLHHANCTTTIVR